MFGRRLADTRIARGYAFPVAAAEATGITEEQWIAMEKGESPVDVLGDSAVEWFRELAKIAGQKESAASLMEAAGMMEDARQERSRR